MKAMDILAGDHRQRFLVSGHSVLTCINYIESSPRQPRFVLVPLRFASEAWPRAGLGEPRGASNANKPASSWPLKQGRKKCSKHGCDRGTSTVASGLGTHKEKKICVDIHVQAAGSQICLQNICGQQRNSPMADPIFVENKHRFRQKFTRSYLTQNENARFTKCQNQWPHSV